MPLSFAEEKQKQADLDAFWEEFRMAVINGNLDKVASLTKFPLGMPDGVEKVKTEIEMKRRYREIFNDRPDAAKCFEKAKLQPNEIDN